MQHNQGVPASPSGYSAEPEPSCTVSAVPVSIPNAVAICEQFIGQILIRRNVSEEIASSGTWHRLLSTPVVSIDTVDGCSPGGFAVDIDSAGDGWVRSIKNTSVPLTVHYCAGMAETMDGVPVPLTEGLKRLERHLEENPDGEPPAVVTALWRPYRRLRLK